MTEWPATVSFKRRKLPHWRVAGRPYFVTFHLKHSLPTLVITALQKERRQMLRECASPMLMDKFARREFLAIEAILDTTDGPQTYLRHPDIAGQVLASFSKLNKRYGWRFPCLVVMPSHVHCLVTGQADATVSLERVLGFLKHFTAVQANKLLHRHGAFWATENFDHWSRTPMHTERICNYILNNPVKAGLVKSWHDWPWLRMSNNDL